ncbi:alkylation response protein AidB-like acyl-CoA dehydrogenase [Nocardioides zeae]|uniref:Alkylation response protein AidB-like acyl-CoA dehydrogenase n=2 Tax=Nocardioides zeae TaxID=1457234 RepID=A0AAJ1TZV0_9ACTN|nr:acyl-CoA dehydrogenase family protein [Nocardioides zeae]MDQ1102933.1 alkylation response protein AidB-like acyl-CoA dehydrogenase [Nocardioides zeae]MDR6173332.1 alkylation response protein AidB-like acyl-CoA dehydrogenase [Nocardioides zeae]MDR6211972.1 alkylation response protein AidB-like acyl-CoA dehydrogenase [Nocardioides zeae]
MAIDFTLSPEELGLRAQAHEFAEKVLSGVPEAIAPLADPLDRFRALQPFYQQMVDAGFVKGLVPAENGGGRFTNLQFALACEELARVDVNVASAVLGTGLGLYPIVVGGTPEQKERFFAPFLDGSPALGAIAFSEAAGAANFDSPDPSVGVQTFAVRDGDSLVINGRKAYTTNASGWDDRGADLISVVCRTDPSKPPAESLAVVVVERGTPGVEITGMIDTMGHLATNSPIVEFRDVRVPLDNMIGTPGEEGMALVKGAFSWTCSSIAAACVGRMRAAFDIAYEFLRTETRGAPVPVIEHQNAGYMLADIKTRIEAGRYLAWKAADQFDKTGGLDRELSNMSKIYNSELSVQVVYDAMRLVGVDAYGDRSSIAPIMQDVLCFPVYDGGNMGVRRRHLHEMLKTPGYDPLAVSESRNSFPA